MKKRLIFSFLMIHVSLFAMENSVDEYVIGAEVDRKEVTVGVFSVNPLRLKHEYTKPTKEISDLSQYVSGLLVDLKNEHGIVVKHACFGAPGNTNAEKNLIYDPHFVSFAIDGKAIQEATSIEHTLVVNDFECLALATERIGESAITTLHQGEPREHGMRAVVGAGNGLGTCLLIWDAETEDYMPSPLSYSFIEFNPKTELELKFAQYLQETTGCQAWGKVLGSSGGILRIYDFLDKHKQYQSEYDEIKDYLDVFGRTINYCRDYENANCIRFQIDERCKDAVTMYMKFYARLVRQVAYAQLPHNGVYITSTIAEYYPQLFTDPSFMEEYFDTQNDYLRKYLTRIPVYLVAQSQMKLYGAALYALACDRKNHVK